MAANFAQYGTPLDKDKDEDQLELDFSSGGTALDLSSAGTPLETPAKPDDRLAAFDTMDVPGQRMAAPEVDPNAAPGRVRTASSQFVRGYGQVASGLPKSLALLKAPDSEIFQNLERIDQGKYAIPQQVYNAVGDPMDNPFTAGLYEDYQKAAPEQRSAIRAELERMAMEAVKSDLYQAGASLDKYIADNFPINEAYQEEFWSSKVPQALGSGAGFLTAAALTRGATGGGAVASYGAPALLGSALNRSGNFEQALNEGADIGTALQASEIGAVIGTTEAIPIGNLLNRLDKVSGGQIKRLMARMVQQGTEEAVQETMSGILNVALAERLYNPEAGIWTSERLEEGAVGFTTGALLEALVTLALPGRRRGDGSTPAPTGAPVTNTELAERVDGRIAELRTKADQIDLTPEERGELDFLIDNRGDLAKIAAEVGLRVEPTFEERVAEETANLTPEDRQSPIPDELIAEGRATTKMAAEEQAKPAEPAQDKVITNKMREDLGWLGYSASDINAMTPASAREILDTQRKKPGTAPLETQDVRETQDEAGQEAAAAQTEETAAQADEAGRPDEPAQDVLTEKIKAVNADIDDNKKRSDALFDEIKDDDALFEAQEKLRLERETLEDQKSALLFERMGRGPEWLRESATRIRGDGNTAEADRLERVAAIMEGGAQQEAPADEAPAQDSRLVPNIMSDGSEGESNFSYRGEKFEVTVSPEGISGEPVYRVGVSVRDSSTETGFRYREDMSREFATIEEAKAYAEKIAAKDSPVKAPESPQPPPVTPPGGQQKTDEDQFEAYKKWIEDNTPETLNESGGMFDSINFDERLTDDQTRQLLQMFDEKADRAGQAPDAAEDIEAAAEMNPEPTEAELDAREEEPIDYQVVGPSQSGKFTVFEDGAPTESFDTREEAEAAMERMRRADTDADAITEEVRGKETKSIIDTLNTAPFSQVSVDNNPEYYRAHVAELESRYDQLSRAEKNKADRAIATGKRVLGDDQAPATTGEPETYTQPAPGGRYDQTYTRFDTLAPNVQKIVGDFQEGMYGKKSRTSDPIEESADPTAYNGEMTPIRGVEAIVDAYNDAQSGEQPAEKYLQEARDAITYNNNRGGWSEGAYGSRHDYFEARWFFEKGKKREVSWDDMSAVVKALKIDLGFGPGKVPKDLTVTEEAPAKKATRTVGGTDILAEQDFGDLKITEQVEVEETGDTATVEESAQMAFRRAVKRVEVLESLLECVRA